MCLALLVCRVRGLLLLSVFFFKQKTAYEMRISDWSSDVCSSDLAGNGDFGIGRRDGPGGRRGGVLRLCGQVPQQCDGERGGRYDRRGSGHVFSPFFYLCAWRAPPGTAGAPPTDHPLL